MSKKILIDLLKLRDYENLLAEGIYKSPDFNNEFKTIRELATFHFTCRKCEATERSTFVSDVSHVSPSARSVH